MNLYLSLEARHFTKFIKDYDINQSNGFIERFVRTIKSTVKKCLEVGDNLNMALMNIRATPVGGKLPSSAELMFNRPMVTLLPSHTRSGREDHHAELQS